MMKRQLFVLLTVVLMLSMIVAACGGAAPAPTTAPAEPAAPAAPAEPTAPAATGEKVTITIAAGAVGNENIETQASAERYMAANPNVEVRVLETPDLSTDRLGLYLQYFQAQSSEVDVYMIDVIWPGDLAEHLVNLYDYGAADVAGDHFPAIIENNTVAGSLVGIPWFTDAGLLYYRTDLLEKYGYSAPPATWEELTEMATTIQAGERATNPDFWGFVWQGNAYEGLTCNALEWVDSAGGGTIVSPDGVITINNPNAVKAIETAASWVGTISPPGVTGMSEEDSRAVFQAGNAAFLRNWPYVWGLAQGDDSAVKGNVGVVPLPAGAKGAGSATLGGWQLGVSKYSLNPEVAADVALFMASEAEQKSRAINAGQNPTLPALYEDADVCAAQPFMCELLDVFTNAVARPSTVTAPKYNQVSTLFFQSVYSVLTGQRQASSAIAELELNLVDLLGFETGAP
jgi:trehalose/maltose transport system substrate-binding protein